jgi:predicted DNA repair protein MutK
MASVRSYRLISLSLLILGVLALFLSFFVLWVLTPVIVIGLFYLVFVFIEERRAKKNGELTKRAQRRSQLAAEAAARERDRERRVRA